MSFFIFFS